MEREIRTCGECPCREVDISSGKVQTFCRLTFHMDWMRAIPDYGQPERGDAPTPAWCPLRDGPITLRLAK